MMKKLTTLYCVRRMQPRLKVSSRIPVINPEDIRYANEIRGVAKKLDGAVMLLLVIFVAVVGYVIFMVVK